MKTHYRTDDAAFNACGRNARSSTQDIRYVTCLNCQSHTSFFVAKREAEAAQEAEYQAQTPRQVKHLMDGHVINCYNCGGDLFKERPRTLFSFHFVCVGCGTSMHPPTETGMCT